MPDIAVTADLVLETWPSAGDGADRPLLKLRSRSLAHDHAGPGCVIIYLDEVTPLVSALIDAAITLIQIELDQRRAAAAREADHGPANQ